ncbi:MAG: hypothetical protein WCP20_22285 [Desulfuromonadales bacterium]
MAQHPYYFKDTKKNLDKLLQLLDDIEQYGLIHEELTQSIKDGVSFVYPKENRKIMIEDLGEEANDPDAYEGFKSSVSALFERVRNKEQFIQDFRNDIAYHLEAEQYPFVNKALAKEIKSMRDLDYYRMHIVDES